MDTVHKQEFRVRDLPTRSVTLFPSRAQVVRDLHDVVLRPGTNEIAVVGLSPTVDPNSIKVEGAGSAAVISDLAVELLPNQDIFEEVYPDEAGDDDDDDDDDLLSESDDENSSDDDEGADVSPELAKARADLRAVRAQIATLAAREIAAREAVRSAVSRLGLLDAHGKAILDPRWGGDGANDGHGHGPPPRIDDVLATYRAERARAFEDHQAGKALQRTLAADMAVLRRREERLVRARRRAAAPARRARRRARSARERKAEAVERRKAVALAEKRRVRQAREACWPRVCYTVRITLEVPVDEEEVPEEEPAETSAAMDEDDGAVGKTQTDTPPADAVCRITLTYLTSAASWSPTYDLQLSTTAATGVLAFDAVLHNHTSETWARCAVVLSTSQTILAGLDDTAVPALEPWRVKLAHSGDGGGGGGGSGAPFGSANDNLLRSREERSWRTRMASAAAGFGGDAATAADGSTPQRPRKELFGLGPMGPPPPRGPPARLPAMACRKVAQRRVPGPPVPAPMAAAAAPSTQPFFLRMAQDVDDDDSDSDSDDDDNHTLGNAPGALGFQESAFEETGLTATYELPGLKTLAPTPPPEGPAAAAAPAGIRKRLATTTPAARAAPPPGSKQRVARVVFAGVQFRHSVVPKYNPTAFLRATLRNPSRLTLLRGPVGLTLDGAFLGRATLPRCGPDGDAITLGLGATPGLRVAYTQPDVRRTTTGRFGKEARTAYTRSVVLTMAGSTTAPSSSASSASSASSPATILVFDQVPISEDEKLRVEVQQPRGLVVDGPPVRTGLGSLAGRNSVQPAADTDVLVSNDAPAAGATVTDWGRAHATLKANGEVVWEVTLQPGRAVRLDLAYEVIMPLGEEAVQC